MKQRTLCTLILTLLAHSAASQTLTNDPDIPLLTQFDARCMAMAGADDGHWDQIVLAVYPSPAAMMTMLSMPRYRSAHVHREAALARTRLLATRPIETL